MRLREAEAPSLGPRAADAVEIARRHFGHMTDRQREAVLASLRTKMAARRRPRAVRWSLAAAAAVVGALVLVLAVRHRGRGDGLSFRVESGELGAGGFVQAGPSTHPVLRFSDGSEVALEPGARAHVRAVDEHGASVTIDEGQAHAYVVHATATRWSFDAGPFVVHVTGTAFGVSWVSATNRLDVRLENGSVTVSGPVFDTPVALRAGQWLTVQAHQVLIRDLSASDDEAAAAALDLARAPVVPVGDLPVADDRAAPRDVESPEPPSPHRAHRKRAASPASTAAATAVQGHGWAAELADGKFASIVEEANALGIDTVCATSRPDDLAALADAGRYTRRYDVAQAALQAQRGRFPASEAARVAAFSLGRLSEARRDNRAALDWFDTYLTEAPEGTYASEALGRKMLLVEQLDGADAARPLATAYLHRFPSGTYAKAAHAIAPGP